MTRRALLICTLAFWVAGCPLTRLPTPADPGPLDASMTDAPPGDAPSIDSPPDDAIPDSATPDVGTMDAAPTMEAGPTVDAGGLLDVDGIALHIITSVTYDWGIPLDVPATFDSTVFLTPGADDSTVNVVQGRHGTSSATTWTRSGNMISGFMAGRGTDEFYGCSNVTSFFCEGTFVLLDTDGDGRADALTGVGVGVLEVGRYDLGYTNPFHATFDGVSDRAPPTLTRESEDGATFQLNRLNVYASEPIPAASFPVLDLGPGFAPRPLVALDGTAEWASRFTLATPDLLPFGADGHVVSTAFRDLAGNGGPFDLPVNIAPDVGQLAENGFEDAAPALVMEGSARIVAGVGTIGAISGSQSLFVPPASDLIAGARGARVIARLAVASGDSRVRATMRLVGGDNYGSIVDGHVRLLSPAGDVVNAGDLRPLAGMTRTSTGDPSFPLASPTFVLDMPLPPGVTDEVVILISTITGPCGHAPFSATNGVLVDDLRVE